jgi:hypothetical protein
MRFKKLMPYVAIIGATLIIDWGLGMLCASGVAPLWTFLVANFPFGGVYVWMESSWAGTHYVMLGQRVGDVGALIIWAVVALAQAGLYCVLWHLFAARRQRSSKDIGQQPVAG